MKTAYCFKQTEPSLGMCEGERTLALQVKVYLVQGYSVHRMQWSPRQFITAANINLWKGGGREHTEAVTRLSCILYMFNPSILISATTCFGTWCKPRTFCSLCPGSWWSSLDTLYLHESALPWSVCPLPPKKKTFNKLFGHGFKSVLIVLEPHEQLIHEIVHLIFGTLSTL